MCILFTLVSIYASVTLWFMSLTCSCLLLKIIMYMYGVKGPMLGVGSKGTLTNLAGWDGG
jgi:hypothetical protein